MTRRDKIVSRETKHMEKFQQKDTWSLALESQKEKYLLKKKKINFQQQWRKSLCSSQEKKVGEIDS